MHVLYIWLFVCLVISYASNHDNLQLLNRMYNLFDAFLVEDLSKANCNP